MISVSDRQRKRQEDADLLWASERKEKGRRIHEVLPSLWDVGTNNNFTTPFSTPQTKQKERNLVEHVFCVCVPSLTIS